MDIHDCEIEITKIKGALDVHKEKGEARDALIRKNNHRAEKNIGKSIKKTDALEEKIDKKSDVKFRNAYYIIGLFMAVLTLVFGMLQKADGENQKLMIDKIDKVEERQSQVLQKVAELKGALEGLKNYTETEIQDRKDYSNVNDEKITELQKQITHIANKLSDDNVEILKELNGHKH